MSLRRAVGVGTPTALLNPKVVGMLVDPFWLIFGIFLVVFSIILFFRARSAAEYSIPEDFDLGDRPMVRFLKFRLVGDDIVWNSVAFVFLVTSQTARYEVSATLSKRTSVKRLS